MTSERFQAITGRYRDLRIAVVGDFCLDRYLEIDPARSETSIETGLPVHNVVNVRSQPGGAGTIVNNLAALGVGTIWPLGFAGEDGEGYELFRALAATPGVSLDHFTQTDARRTFTYCKPLIIEPGKTPCELSRLDQKNWTATPPELSERLGAALISVADHADAIILLSQVDEPETGVLTTTVLESARQLVAARPQMVILADSRRGLSRFPPVIFKMNAAELAALTGTNVSTGVAQDLTETLQAANTLARRNGRPVIVTLAERGIVGVSPNGEVEHIPARQTDGEIDIVGAGDAVTANLTAALAAGATVREALVLAEAAASIVIRQLGTTGSASVEQLQTAVHR
jgi:rfaE bifunctional protein kinase chain/domain